jgi:hypothetical protein
VAWGPRASPLASLGKPFQHAPRNRFLGVLLSPREGEASRRRRIGLPRSEFLQECMQQWKFPPARQGLRRELDAMFCAACSPAVANGLVGSILEAVSELTRGLYVKTIAIQMPEK